MSNWFSLLITFICIVCLANSSLAAKLRLYRRWQAENKAELFTHLVQTVEEHQVAEAALLVDFWQEAHHTADSAEIALPDSSLLSEEEDDAAPSQSVQESSFQGLEIGANNDSEKPDEPQSSLSASDLSALESLLTSLVSRTGWGACRPSPWRCQIVKRVIRAQHLP